MWQQPTECDEPDDPQSESRRLPQALRLYRSESSIPATPSQALVTLACEKT